MEETSEPRLDFRAVKGMDPAANWLLHVGADDYLPEQKSALLPMLLELEDEEAVRAFEKVRLGGAAVLVIGSGNETIGAGNLLPVLATRAWLEELLTEGKAAFRDANKRIVLSSPMDLPGIKPLSELPAQIRLDWGSDPPPPKDGLETVVAAIDDGFALAHERFQAKDGGTRIEAFWDMNGNLPLVGGTLKEHSKAKIDDWMAQDTPVDEDAVYRRAGLLDHGDPRHKPLAWRASHGTHVLDLAAGSEPDKEGPPIIAVQLPSPVVARTTGELLDFHVWLGVLYVRHRAGRRPVVINISFGYDAGPHDGRGLLEKHLSRLAEKCPKTVVVLPAGNAQLSRCHATIDLSSGTPVELDWIVQPDDRTHSVIEVWLPHDTKGDRMTLTVTLPDGAPFTLREPESGETSPSVPLVHAGRKMGLAEVWERPDGRRMFRIAIAPTARPQPDERALAPAGRWTLRFEAGRNPLCEPAHAWVQRDDSLYGYPQRGRQSYFDHPDYLRFDDYGYEMDDDPPSPSPACPVTRTSLLNAIATSANVIVAGGYRSRDCRIARYSSGGPNVSTGVEPPPLKKPDVLLPSDGSPAHPGVLAAGARSGARVAMDGTSVAAPQLARYVVGWLGAAADPGRPAVRAAVAPRFACQVPTASDRDGHGRMDRLDPPPVKRFVPGD